MTNQTPAGSIQAFNLGSLEIFRIQSFDGSATLERLVQPETWVEMAKGSYAYVSKVLANQVFQTLKPKSEEHCKTIVSDFMLPFTASELWEAGKIRHAEFSTGWVTISMTYKEASTMCHTGTLSGPLNERHTKEWIAANQEQVNALSPSKIRLELREYGAWEDDQLEDDEQNLIRIVWLAANNIHENEYEEE